MRLLATLGQQVNVKAYFYHLTQRTWRKMQELGLSVAYRKNKDLKHFCGMLDGLAFLPLADVAARMAYLRGCMPMGSLDAVVDLVDYFDTTNVTGSVRRIFMRPAQSHRIQHYTDQASLHCSPLQLSPLLLVASLYIFKFPLFHYLFVAALLCSRLQLLHLLFGMLLYYFFKVSII